MMPSQENKEKKKPKEEFESNSSECLDYTLGQGP